MSNITLQDAWISQEILYFRNYFDLVVNASNIAESVLISAGVFGNAAALLVFYKSQQMRTVSFAYHKTLLVAYFVYCLNFLFVKVLKLQYQYGTSANSPDVLIFRNSWSAYYCGVINRALSSATGFTVLYTTLLISFDRFVALIFFSAYKNFNRRRVARFLLITSVFLSTCVHSWSPWFETVTQPVVLANSTAFEGSSGQNSTQGEDAHIFYSIDSHEGGSTLNQALRVKNACNGLVRVAYVCALSTFTFAVIFAFARQGRKRKRMLCTQASTQSLGNRTRNGRSLFCLMVAAVALAYVQVLPRETKRLLEFLYPKNDLIQYAYDHALPVESRRYYFRMFLNAYYLLTPVANVCTAAERSLFFYLNFALNYNFRKEMCGLWKCACYTSQTPDTSTRRLSRVSLMHTISVVSNGYRTVSLGISRRFSTQRNTTAEVQAAPGENVS